MDPESRSSAADRLSASEREREGGRLRAGDGQSHGSQVGMVGGVHGDDIDMLSTGGYL